MLPPVSALNSAILGLTPLANQHTALVNFVNVIADHMDQVQAAGGGPGILTVNRPVFVAQLETQAPTADSSWIPNFGLAWFMGVAQGTIAPGTVSNGAWSGGSSVDILTPGNGAGAIPNLSAARAVLEAGLANVKGDNSAAMPMAQAIQDGTLAMIFLCIGLSAGGSPVPVPCPAS